MKKHVCLAALMACTAAVLADVRVFVTPGAAGYGLTDPTLAFTPTLTYPPDPMGSDDQHFIVNSFPPIDAPSGDAAQPVAIAPTDFAYIWLQFRDEPRNVRINGLKILVRELGSAAPADVTTCYYVQNCLATLGRKRWDGIATPPDFPEWHNNPQAMVAVIADGLTNADDPPMMWHAQDDDDPRTSIGLIGAVAGTPGQTYEILIPGITDINYADGTTPNGIAGGVFQFVPEPASLVLLGLMCLLVRRR